MKKPTKKIAKSKREPKANADLRKPQIRILAALAKAKTALTRAEIADKAPVDNAFCTEYLGSLNPDIRAKNDANGCKSLLTLKLIKAEPREVDGKKLATYSITAAGKSALERTAN